MIEINSASAFESHKIRIRAYELIALMREKCLSGSKCLLKCSEDFESCPDIEYFKKLARGELEKEGVI